MNIPRTPRTLAGILRDVRRTAGDDYDNAYDENGTPCEDLLSELNGALDVRTHLSDAENATVTDADVQTCAREYACAYVAIIQRARSAANTPCDSCAPGNGCRCRS